MKILFIHKAYNDQLDGGDLYNLKLIKGLTLLGHEVKAFSLTKCGKGFIPFWKWRISYQDIRAIRSIEIYYDMTIISHENLASLTKFIKCDLFIFHNLFSCIRSDFFILNCFYKFGARFHENVAIVNSRKVLLLSFREYSFLNEPKAIYCPPGIDETIQIIDDSSVLCIPSSSAWILKRKSKLSDRELNNLSRHFDVIENNGFSRVGIIEDKFECGFKMRLIQMLFNCDLVISKIDLSQEINAIGCSAKNFFVFKDFAMIDVNDILNRVNVDVNMKNRIHLMHYYSWVSVASKCISYIEKDDV